MSYVITFIAGMVVGIVILCLWALCAFSKKGDEMTVWIQSKPNGYQPSAKSDTEGNPPSTGSSVQKGGADD